MKGRRTLLTLVSVDQQGHAGVAGLAVRREMYSQISHGPWAGRPADRLPEWGCLNWVYYCSEEKNAPNTKSKRNLEPLGK